MRSCLTDAKIHQVIQGLGTTGVSINLPNIFWAKAGVAAWQLNQEVMQEVALLKISTFWGQIKSAEQLSQRLEREMCDPGRPPLSGA